MGLIELKFDQSLLKMMGLPSEIYLGILSVLQFLDLGNLYR